MQIFDSFYSIFLCLTREDGTGERHKRAAAFLEMIITFLLSFLTMLVLGIFNLRMTNFILWILVIAVHGIISYLLINRYFIKSGRYLEIVENVSKYNVGKKLAYAILAAFVVLFSLGMLIGGGILMSYLFSQQGVLS